MKINRFIALAAIAMIAIGAMGFVTSRVYAQAHSPVSAPVQVTSATEEPEAVGPDTDTVEEQVGDQNAVDDPSKEAAETASKDGQDAAPTGTPAITTDAALLAAQTSLGTTDTGIVQLDDENGKLIYSVKIGTSEVKIDAMTGAVLPADQDGEY